MNEILKHTPIYDDLKILGGKMVPFAGYKMAVQFTGIKDEHNAVRNKAGIFDVSHMCEFWLEGPDALEYAHWLVTNDVKGLADGQICYTPMCNSDGGIVDDLLVYRYGKEKILLVLNAACHDKDLQHVQKNVRGNVKITDKSYETGQIALQGPASVKILGNITDNKYKDLDFFTFVEDEIAGCQCLISRTGYTAEDGYEIYCHNDHLKVIFNAIMESGVPLGLQPIGLGARDTLRLEGKLSLYGNDIDLSTSPLEALLGWTVKFETGDFNGRDALLKQKENGLTRKLVGFEMIDKGIGRHGYPVVSDGSDANAKPIGHITSGSPSITLNKNIGLVYLPKKGYKIGKTFGVVIRGKVKQAKVIKTPFYKKQ